MLKDKRVLALVQKKAAELEGKDSKQDWDMKEIVTYVSQRVCFFVIHMLSMSLKIFGT